MKMRSTLKKSLTACCSLLLVMFLSCDKDDDSGVSGDLPQVKTLEVTDLTGNSAVSGGEVLADGGAINSLFR